MYNKGLEYQALKNKQLINSKQMSILEAVPTPDYADFQKAILGYYSGHGRVFPWRTDERADSILVPHI